MPSPWDVPEASGAAMVELVPGRRELLVVSDSGNAGAALAYDPTASTFRSLKLPLDAAASDDVEGVAWRDGALFTLTSSGAVRVFHPDGRGGLAASGPSYRLGAPPASCPNLSEANCGKNWEGLCLRASGSGGWAASKTEGTLYPVAVVAAGSSKRLALDPARAPLHLGDLEAHALSDCSFGPGDRLLVTTNLHGGAVSYVVDEATGAAAEIAAPGTLSNEVIVVDDSGALYQLEDDNGEVSGAVRAKCTW